MKHYFNPMSRAITTHWMLTELDVEHDQVIVDVQAGESRTPEYRAINPMGKIPTLVDDGVVVTEVAAICAYLADKYPDKGFAPPTDSPVILCKLSMFWTILCDAARRCCSCCWNPKIIVHDCRCSRARSPLLLLFRAFREIGEMAECK